MSFDAHFIRTVQLGPVSMVLLHYCWRKRHVSSEREAFHLRKYYGPARLPAPLPNQGHGYIDKHMQKLPQGIQRILSEFQER